MDEETGVVPFPPADRVQLALEGVKREQSRNEARSPANAKGVVARNVVNKARRKKRMEPRLNPWRLSFT